MKNRFHFIKVFTILWLCCMQLGAAAQKEIVAGLQKQLVAAKNPRIIIDLSNKLSYELRLFMPDSALNIAKRALALAQKENYEKGIAVSTLCLGMGNSVKGNYELAFEYGNKAAALAEAMKNDSLKAAANLVIATYYYNKSNYDLAIEKSVLAIQLYQKINNREGITKARVGMAQTYQLKNDLPQAEKILREISQEQGNDVKVQVNVLHTLANIYGMQEKYDSALALDLKALAICERNQLDFLKSSVYDNMANCYMYSGDYPKSKKYFLISLALDSSFENKKQMADTYLNLGQLDLLQKDYHGAISNLLHSISLSQISGYRQGTYVAYLLLSKVYAADDQKDSALVAVNKGYLIKDSIINESSESKIAEYETLFQTERKEQELKLQKTEINKKNYFLIALSVVILLLASLGILYFRKRTLQTKMDLQNEVLKQQDLATKAIIEAEENERRRIAADLHDGVGQMMSAAKMNLSVFEHELPFSNEAQRSSFENVIGLIDESCKEIRNVSHQMMPNALLKSGLASAIKEFLAKIDTRIIRVGLHTEGLNERLEGNVETVLYRVIQECVNNALKHSGADHLDISVIKDHEGISATIEDNGRGFDVSEVSHVSGIGLKNTISRIKYLQGTIDFNSKPGRGTVVAIHIPGA